MFALFEPFGILVSFYFNNFSTDGFLIGTKLEKMRFISNGNLI